MKISIVTASFNQGCYVRDCIESVKSQTGVEWEHIIQDAGSTDQTLAVLQEYPAARLKPTQEGLVLKASAPPIHRQPARLKP